MTTRNNLPHPKNTAECLLCCHTAHCGGTWCCLSGMQLLCNAQRKDRDTYSFDFHRWALILAERRTCRRSSRHRPSCRQKCCRAQRDRTNRFQPRLAREHCTLCRESRQQTWGFCNRIRSYTCRCLGHRFQSNSRRHPNHTQGN